MSGRGWLLFCAVGVLWGIPYLMIKVAVDAVSVPVVVFSRCAIGALVLLPLALRQGGFRRLAAHWRPVLAFAVIEVMGPWALLSHAERELSSSMTGLLVAAVPVLAALLARLAGHERLSGRRWAGLLLGLGGVALLAGPHLGGGGGPLPMAEMLLVVFGYALAPMIVARRMREVPTLPLTAVTMALAAAVYAVPAALTRPDAVPPPGVLASLAGLGVLCTGLGFALFLELIREVGASRAVVFTYLNPAVAVTAGVLILGEPLTPAMAGAFVLIIAGSFLATARGGAWVRVRWRARQTSRAGGRVGVLAGPAEERPGSTGQGGG